MDKKKILLAYFLMGIVLVTHDYNLLSHFDKHYLLEKEGLKLVD